MVTLCSWLIAGSDGFTLQTAPFQRRGVPMDPKHERCNAVSSTFMTTATFPIWTASIALWKQDRLHKCPQNSESICSTEISKCRINQRATNELLLYGLVIWLSAPMIFDCPSLLFNRHSSWHPSGASCSRVRASSMNDEVLSACRLCEIRSWAPLKK